MDIANLIVILILMHYSVHIFKMLFSKKNRNALQSLNNRLEELRSKPIKSIEEQKEFITLKKPKRIGTFKWSWMIIPQFIISAIPYIIIFQIYAYIFNYLGVQFVLWQSILILIIFPLIINIVLTKFGIQKNDIGVFFRKSRRGKK